MTVPAAVIVPPRPARALCGAKTKQKTAKYPTCHRPAGWGTDHAGVGRCKLHAGSSLLKHGRYARLIRPRVAELIEQYANDPDPLNVLPELALARAMLVDYVERYDVWREAFLAWHATWAKHQRPLPVDLVMAFGNVIDDYEDSIKGAMAEGQELTDRQKKELEGARGFLRWLRGEEEPARPREVLDVAAAITWVNQISQMIKREQDARAENAISRKDLNRVMTEMGRSLLKRVTDLETLKAIRSDWMEIRV